MFALGVIDDTGGTAVVVGQDFLRWDVDSTLLDEISAGQPASSGEPVARWLAADGSSALDRANSAQRPTADLNVFPGRQALHLTGDQSLAGPLPAAPLAILLVFAPGNGTLAARDTTQATTEPAFAISVEDYVP